jgi:hypothetical protein
VFKRLLLIAFLINVAAQMNAQAVPRPEVPDAIQAPAGEDVVLQARASGSQIYVCQAAPGGAFAWRLKAPQADLYDQQGAIIGQHSAGPTWKDKDGSEVTGKAVAHVDSPDSASIPWLLVNVTGHSGAGVLSRVTSVQRIRTKGGVAPAAANCNASKLNTEAKSSYTADYYFYAPAK